MMREKVWRKLQKLEWQDYRARGGQGVFSVPTHKRALKVAKILPDWTDGPVLDIGCGCLPRPSYMSDGIEFVGIDPFFGDKKRKFPFTQAIGERLPFADGSFPAVLFAQTIDHCINPLQALREAWRVLTKGGILFVWYSRRWGSSYEQWIRQGGLYNQHHQWAWTDDTMKETIKKAGFKPKRLYRICKQKNRLLVSERR